MIVKARQITMIPGRWVVAWEGSDVRWRGVPRLAVQCGPNWWWRIDCFGRVFSAAFVEA